MVRRNGDAKSFAVLQVAYFGQGNKIIEFFSKLGLHCDPLYNPADFIRAYYSYRLRIATFNAIQIFQCQTHCRLHIPLLSLNSLSA